MIPYLSCVLSFRSNLPLPEVAAEVSTLLLGNCPMVEEYVWGETSYHNRLPVLGLMCVLNGSPSHGYFLEILPANGSECSPGSDLDLGPLVAHYLATAEHIREVRVISAVP
ncbi:MAG: hypothetical protein ACAI44_10000 [Candidatus Sericytochromatia bacterium]